MYLDARKFLPEEILVYLRKSRSDDPTLTVEEVLEKHEILLNEWIEKNLDGPIPEENWFRELVSGETIASRQEFKKILKKIESPQYKAVLVVECVRLGRPDLEEIGKISKLFRYTNTAVITRERTFVLADEYEREQFERELMRGNDYLQYFKKIQKRGMDLSYGSGNFTKPVSPYGYDKVKVVINGKKHPTLAINEEEAKVVRMIFRWYADEGIGAYKIANRLNEMGLRTRNGILWKKATITKMLENETYLGKIRKGLRTAQYEVLNQEVIKKRVYNQDYELIDGKHDAIIDDELFARANSKHPQIPRTKADLELSNPLASLLRCRCGCVMEYKKRKDRSDRYICAEQHVCHSASVTCDEVINALCDKLKESIEDFTVSLNNTDEQEIQIHKERIELLESKYKDAEAREIALWEKYTEEGMPKTIFEKLKEKYEEERKSLETALVDAYQNMPDKVDYETKIVSLHQAIDMLKDDSISAQAKNTFLKSIIEKIVYYRPPAVKYTKEEWKEKGLKTVSGWYLEDFELDVYLFL